MNIPLNDYELSLMRFTTHEGGILNGYLQWLEVPVGYPFEVGQKIPEKWAIVAINSDTVDLMRKMGVTNKGE